MTNQVTELLDASIECQFDALGRGLLVVPARRMDKAGFVVRADRLVIDYTNDGISWLVSPDTYTDIDPAAEITVSARPARFGLGFRLHGGPRWP